MAVRALVLLALSIAGCATVPAQEPAFPVVPEPFITRFDGAEGITFNGEGRLFIGANNAVWEAQPDGSVRRLTDVHRHLGQAGIGPRDILAADFGPTNAFQHGPNDDGIVWRITPEGERTHFATGIGDPNAILRLPDGTWLVSDDAVDIIYRVPAGGGRAGIWSRAVPFPNGMALSRDGRRLYVAQIFSAIGPVIPDNAIWRSRSAPAARPARRGSSRAPSERRTASPPTSAAGSTSPTMAAARSAASIRRPASRSSSRGAWPTSPAWCSAKANSTDIRSTPPRPSGAAARSGGSASERAARGPTADSSVPGGAALIGGW